MSIRGMKWAHNICLNYGLSSGEKAVLTWLAYHHYDKNNACCPSVETLANLTGLSARQVQRMSSSLQALGLIRKFKRHGATGKELSSGYALFGKVDFKVFGARRKDGITSKEGCRGRQGVGDAHVTPIGVTPMSPNKDKGSSTSNVVPLYNTKIGGGA